MVRRPSQASRWHAYGSVQEALAAERQLADAIPPGSRWEDPWCGARLGDLLYHDCGTLPPGAVPPDLVSWCRLSCDEVLGCANPVLLPQHGPPAELVQGRLADAWLLNALGLLGASEEGRTALRGVIVSERFAAVGLYTLRFWKRGRWVFVHVDDRIPCDASGAPLFSRSAEGNQVWVLLIEKAMAKLHGSYLNLEHGLLAEGLRDLTGGAVQSVAMDWDALEAIAVPPTASSKPLAARLVVARRRAPRKSAKGISSGWVYPVTGLFEPANAGVRLVRVQDVWRRSRWKGPWAAGDQCWEDAPAVKEALLADDELPEDDYFIAWNDFCEAFDQVFCCALCAPDEDPGAGWVRHAYRGEFEKGSVQSGPGGSPNVESRWLNNPMLSFTVLQDASLAVVFGQGRDPRMDDFFDPSLHRGFLQQVPVGEEGPEAGDGHGGPRDSDSDSDASGEAAAVLRKNAPVLDCSGLGVLLVRVGDAGSGRRRVAQLTPDRVVDSSGSTYLNQREVGLFAASVPRGDYVVVPSTFAADVCGTFELEIYARGSTAGGGPPLELHVSPEDDLTQALNALAVVVDEDEDEASGGGGE